MPQHQPTRIAKARAERLGGATRPDSSPSTEEGSRALLLPPVPQRTAIEIARLIARANRSELIVQDRLGRIRFRDSHGSDPFPPRG